MKTLNIFLFILCVNSLFAQKNQYMYSKEVTRAIDLREKQNEPLMATGNELTKFLIEATKEGRLTAYSSDSLRTQDKLTINTFLDNITLYVNEVEEDCFCDEFCDCDDSSSTSSTEYYFPRDLYQVEITEDVLFDKKQSTMVIQTKSLALFIPADHPDNMRGIQELVAVYDFDELKTLWNSTPEAVWINPHNDQEYKNLSDAFV